MPKTNSDHTAKPCKILECTCEHDFQDQKHGRNKRVHNPKAAGKYSCTVCGRIKDS